MSNPTVRRADLDWLRLIAIIILLFYHTGMWFNTWGWHVKNSETSSSFNYWMVWLHYWRMPLLLFISGAGTYMAMSKRTSGEYARERFKRLFIPLLFGMFVIVPPQIYYEHINEYDGYWDFYKTVFNFVPYPKGSFSWHHLWFVLYLFLYSLILIPFLRFLRSEKSKSFKEKTTRWLSSPAGMLLIPAGIILGTQIILRPFFPDETHDLTDLGFFVFYMMFFAFGTLFYSNTSLWEAIGKNRNHLMAAAAIMLIPFYAMYLHIREDVVYPLTTDTVETIFDISAIILSWYTVIAVIGIGQHYLNEPKPWLRYVNEGLYPFYILHQTVIIAIGYYICKLDWGIAAKFFTISLLTLISCALIIAFVIRPIGFLRLVMGLKKTKS